MKLVVRGFVAWAFGIALGLLFVLVLRSVSAQITPPPGLTNEPYPDISTQEKCEAQGGRWVEQNEPGAPVRPVAVNGKPSLYCQGPLKFERDRDAQSERSQQTSLFVFAIGGALAITGALMLEALRPVAPGLMLGGIVSFLIAGFHVWTLAPGLGRLLTIVGVFIVLVIVGMRVFREQGVA